MKCEQDPTVRRRSAQTIDNICEVLHRGLDLSHCSLDQRVFHPETNDVKASPHRHKWMLSRGAPADPSDPWNSRAAPVSRRQNWLPHRPAPTEFTRSTAASLARDDQTSQGIPRRPILIANQPVQIFSPVNRSSQDAILKGFLRVVCSCGGSDEPAVRFAKMQPCLLGILKRRS